MSDCCGGGFNAAQWMVLNAAVARHGGQWDVSGQTIADVTLATLTFDVERSDSDGWGAPPFSVFTIPVTDWWTFSLAVHVPSALNPGSYARAVCSDGVIFDAGSNGATGEINNTFSRPFSVGQTVTFSARQVTGGSKIVTAQLYAKRDGRS